MSVFNPSVFIGQDIGGATAGAPLSTDSNGDLVSGISNTEVSATASVTAGTGAAALLTGMTITPVSGTYLVWFSCALTCSTTGATTTFAIHVGGTQKADSVRIVAPFDGGAASSLAARCGVAINGLVTVNGSQAIEIRWNASSGTNSTSTRTMNILRVL